MQVQETNSTASVAQLVVPHVTQPPSVKAANQDSSKSVVIQSAKLAAHNVLHAMPKDA
jgi:hypothetical protein